MKPIRKHFLPTIFFCLAAVLPNILVSGLAADSPSSSTGKPPLLLSARTLSAGDPSAALPALTTEDGMALHLIQFSGPIQDEWLAAVEATGAELVHYVANYGFLVWAGQSSRGQLNRMASRGDFLVYSAPYSADLKPDAALRRVRSQADDKDKTVMVTIQMLRHNGRFSTEKRLQEIAIELLSPWEPILNYQNIRAVVPVSQIDTIANLPDVVWVGAYEPPKMMDEKQGQILAGNLSKTETEPNGPGYLDWLIAQGFSDDPQDYPIIDITDDGIGTGVASLAAGDSTMRLQGDQKASSRIAYLNDCTEANDPSGPDGHGHLNASIAAGYDDREGTPYRDENGYQRGMGVNPFGRLAGTRVFEGPYFNIMNCSSSYLVMLQQSYRAGARIINNSWGCTSINCTSQYTPDAQAYDTAVRDADSETPGNQELFILFSAGNVGSPDSVGSPGNGKNVVAVGASENVRPFWTDSCGYGSGDADNLQDIAGYSSRGPAPGGRIKPDFVAPGTHITGTASTSAAYNGSAICDDFFPDGQTIFTASTGTSHAVPAVAGIASLASFWLAENKGIKDPSPALFRAFLAASARYLQGTGAGDDLPSNSQGFGLPDMNRAFGNQSRVIFEQGDAPTFDESGEFWKLSVRSKDSTLPVRIVMAFTDYPGAVWVEDPRVNDLDLAVTLNERVYLGNEMDGQWSHPGGSTDEANTIEAVFLPAGESAPFEIKVTAANIAGDGVPGSGDNTDQDFALVCDNCEIDKAANYTYNYFFPIFID
ncbi:MAG: S8 family serine peptidase [Candidatus Promineifilaceae bacterium]